MPQFPKVQIEAVLAVAEHSVWTAVRIQYRNSTAVPVLLRTQRAGRKAATNLLLNRIEKPCAPAIVKVELALWRVENANARRLPLPILPSLPIQARLPILPRNSRRKRRVPRLAAPGRLQTCGAVSERGTDHDHSHNWFKSRCRNRPSFVRKKRRVLAWA